jgi:hypothetical protein
MVIVSGATGSGKSTLIAGMTVAKLRDPECHCAPIAASAAVSAHGALIAPCVRRAAMPKRSQFSCRIYSPTGAGSPRCSISTGAAIRFALTTAPSASCHSRAAKIASRWTNT